MDCNPTEHTRALPPPPPSQRFSPIDSCPHYLFRQNKHDRLSSSALGHARTQTNSLPPSNPQTKAVSRQRRGLILQSKTVIPWLYLQRVALNDARDLPLSSTTHHSPRLLSPALSTCRPALERKAKVSLCERTGAGFAKVKERRSRLLRPRSVRAIDAWAGLHGVWLSLGLYSWLGFRLCRCGKASRGQVSATTVGGACSFSLSLSLSLAPLPSPRLSLSLASPLTLLLPRLLDVVVFRVVSDAYGSSPPSFQQ